MLIKVFMVCRSRLVSFYFKEKFCVSHTSTSRLQDVYLFCNLVEKIISPVIFHTNSYGNMLFLAPNNCASLTFFKEKFRVSARVSKSLAWTVFTCVEKMLSFGCMFAARRWD